MWEDDDKQWERDLEKLTPGEAQMALFFLWVIYLGLGALLLFLIPVVGLAVLRSLHIILHMILYGG